MFRLSGFRTAYVFDVAQTEGRPLPEFAQTMGDPKDYGEKLKQLVSKQGVSVEYDSTIAPAQGISASGRIHLMPGLSAAEEFSVLTHELAHEMLHHKKEGSPLPKLMQETRAAFVWMDIRHMLRLLPSCGSPANSVGAAAVVPITLFKQRH